MKNRRWLGLGSVAGEDSDCSGAVERGRWSRWGRKTTPALGEGEGCNRHGWRRWEEASAPGWEEEESGGAQGEEESDVGVGGGACREEEESRRKSRETAPRQLSVYSFLMLYVASGFEKRYEKTVRLRRFPAFSVPNWTSQLSSPHRSPVGSIMEHLGDFTAFKYSPAISGKHHGGVEETRSYRTFLKWNKTT